MTINGEGTEKEMDIRTSNNASFIGNGGYLLHRAFWDDETFRDKIKQYGKYQKVNYWVYTVVFYGYGKMSIKYYENLKRLKSQQASAYVLVFEEGAIHYSRKKF